MISPKYEPRDFSDAVIGYLELLTNSFLQGNLLAIIPMLAWIAIAILIWLTTIQIVVNYNNQTSLVIHSNDKECEPTLPQWNQSEHSE